MSGFYDVSNNSFGPAVLGKHNFTGGGQVTLWLSDADEQTLSRTTGVSMKRNQDVASAPDIEGKLHIRDLDPSDAFKESVRRVIVVTASRTLTAEDGGALLVCTNAGAIVITIPVLAPGFNVDVARWGAGTVALTAGTGVTNRSAFTAVSAQYKIGKVLVINNPSPTTADIYAGEI